MKKSFYKTLYQSVILLFSIFILITILFNAFLSYNNFITEKEKMRDDIINSKKAIMKNKVDFFITDIESSRKKLQEKTKQELQKRVEVAYNIAENLYKTQHNNPNIQSIIIESLRELKFYDIGDQYVFMTKLDGTFLLVSGLKHLEGKNVFNLTTESNTKSIHAIIDMVKKEKKGFFEYKWQNHNTLKFEEKISYFKYFEPFDCYIGTGVFLKDIEEKLKKHFLAKIDNFRFGENLENYIFSASYDGISYTEPAKGKNMYEATDINGLKVVQELIKVAKKGSGFLQYALPLGKDKQLDKISYVVGIDKWQLYVGFGETLKDMNQTIENKKQELLSELYTDITISLFFGMIFLVLFYLILHKLKVQVSTDIENLMKSIFELVNNNKAIELQTIKFKEFEQISIQTNQLLKNKIEIEKNLKEKEMLLYQQSKMASMGELLENIAHQWRQPLSIITVESSGIQAKKEYGQLDDKYLDEALEHINENANYLSNTIDDFRNFFISNVKKENFTSQEIINTTFKLLKTRNKVNNIKIIEDIENISITSYKNPLLQVLLIILNNSYDALEKIEYEKYIFIHILKKENNIEIFIKDNAGGIKPKNLDKIFEPYYTTKHRANGTGIGLYMAREIIMKQLHGNITATNKKYKYKKKEYLGAQFIITFPASV